MKRKNTNYTFTLSEDEREYLDFLTRYAGWGKNISLLLREWYRKLYEGPLSIDAEKWKKERENKNENE